MLRCETKKKNETFCKENKSFVLTQNFGLTSGTTENKANVPLKPDAKTHTKKMALVEKWKPVFIGGCNDHKYAQSANVGSSINHKRVDKWRFWVFRSHRGPGRKKRKQKDFLSEQHSVYDGKIYFNLWILVGEQKGKKGENQKNFCAPIGINRIQAPKYKAIALWRDYRYGGKRLDAYSAQKQRSKSYLNNLTVSAGLKFLWNDAMDVDHGTAWR